MFGTVFKNSFLFSITKKLENLFGYQKLFFVFCYQKIENRVFSDNTF